jgi:hypothetical protein
MKEICDIDYIKFYLTLSHATLNLIMAIAKQQQMTLFARAKEYAQQAKSISSSALRSANVLLNKYPPVKVYQIIIDHRPLSILQLRRLPFQSLFLLDILLRRWLV